MSVALLPNARQPFIDGAGNPLAGGQVFFYLPGTLTPKTTWSDIAGLIPNANPVILDAEGTATIWAVGPYREIVRDAFGNLISDSDTLAVPATPIGAGMDFWGSTAPARWLFCYGQAISRTAYAELFAVLGTTYGVGDGSTTFNLPDKRGRASVPRDNMGGSSAARVSAVLASTTLGAAGGDQNIPTHLHPITDPTHTHGLNNPTHTHGVTDPTHFHAYFTDVAAGAGAQPQVLGPGVANVKSYNTSAAATGVTVDAAATAVTANAAATGITATGNTGAGTGLNVQPSIICNYIIYAGV